MQVRRLVEGILGDYPIFNLFFVYKIFKSVAFKENEQIGGFGLFSLFWVCCVTILRVETL